MSAQETGLQESAMCQNLDWSSRAFIFPKVRLKARIWVHMQTAPVVLFLYNRPIHSKRTLEHLAQNTFAKYTNLYVFIDGPKRTEDELLQDQLAQICQEFASSFKSIEITRSKINKGLALSVTEGVTQIVNEAGAAIVLEDDLLTSKVFLEYMHNGLELYREDKNVFSINGYMFPIHSTENTTFLSPLATSSWGWATWKDRWANFSMETPFQGIIQENDFLKRRFNVGDLDYISYLNNNKSWAIRWYYSVFIRNGLGVFPTKSLVLNIGHDGSGENCGNSQVYQTQLNTQLPQIKHESVINMKYEALLQNHFKQKTKKEGKNGITTKIKNRIKKLITL